MEVKKSPKADLEGKKTIFLEIGFVIALGILLSAFNWKTNTKVEEGFVITQEEQVEEEIIPITQQMMKPPPPPPPAPKLTDLIEIVEDELSIDEELEIDDAEADVENKNNYNFDMAVKIIEEYDRILPLTREDYRYIYILYSYPEKFWKVSNRYMNSRKCWISPANLEKLSKLITDEQEKQKFLSDFCNHYGFTS